MSNPLLFSSLQHFVWFCLISCLGAFSSLYSQSSYHIEPVSLEHGVAHQFISCVQQARNGASRGMLWFGTAFGLIKYDGYNYTSYRHDPKDSFSLANDDISCLYEDSAANLWIGTSGGLHKWEHTEEKFTRYLHDPNEAASLSHNNVYAIYESRSGALWVGTSEGLNLFDKNTGQFTRFQHDPNDPASLSHNNVQAVFEDRNGTLWIGTWGGGLNRFAGEPQRFTHYRHDSKQPASLSHDRISSICEDRNGSLWIGTAGGGLNRFVREQEAFAHYRHAPEQPASLSSNAVNLVYEDADGALWIGTNRGLNRFDPARETFERFFEPNAAFNNNGSGLVTAICRDDAGTMWVGTSHSGLYRMFVRRCNFTHYGVGRSNSPGMQHNFVRALCEDRTGKIWVGTVAGLQFYDEAQQRFRTQPLASAQSSRNNGQVVNALCESRNGELWVATFDGLNRFDAQRRQLKLYRHDPAQPASLSTNQITALYESRREELWVGTGAGLYRYDRARDVFIRFEHDTALTQAAARDYVLTLFEDHRSVLWIGAYGGLTRLDSARKVLTHFQHDAANPRSLSNDFCFALGEDDSGALWVGTGGGLHRFDETTTTFRAYTEKNGLPNSVICGILAEEQGRLWVSTQKGLARFDPATQAFNPFDLSDGLQSNMFNAGAFAKRRNGEMLFGGLNGFNRFHPASLQQNPHAPQVAITACKVFDRPRRLQYVRAAEHALQLAHHENFFSFEFAALDFTQPEKNQYAYRLEGFDRDWIHAGTRRYASYTNLAPGNYIFRVKASNNDGVWNEQGARVSVRITPPFWQKRWFLGMCCAAGVAALAFFHHHRVRARLKHFAALEQVRRSENERVRQKAANDFHDELGHRLTKIALFSELVKRKLNGASSEVAVYLDKIVADSQRLTNETRDFIWSLDPAKDSVYEVILYLKDFAEELFDRTDIAFQSNGLAPELAKLRLSADAKRHLTLIFKEGLHNILKHAECRHVVLEARAEGERLQITLRDDGLGRNGQCHGAGRGLASMQIRAQKLGGEIKLETPAEGGTFLVLTMACKHGIAS